MEGRCKDVSFYIVFLLVFEVFWWYSPILNIGSRFERKHLCINESAWQADKRRRETTKWIFSLFIFFSSSRLNKLPVSARFRLCDWNPVAFIIISLLQFCVHVCQSNRAKLFLDALWQKILVKSYATYDEQINKLWRRLWHNSFI
jgi:hypothetical protein